MLYTGAKKLVIRLVVDIEKVTNTAGLNCMNRRFYSLVSLRKWNVWKIFQLVAEVYQNIGMIGQCMQKLMEPHNVRDKSEVTRSPFSKHLQRGVLPRWMLEIKLQENSRSSLLTWKTIMQNRYYSYTRNQDTQPQYSKLWYTKSPVLLRYINAGQCLLEC